MNILVFDNYDSFTYNLVHLVEKIINGKVTVVRNDEIPLEKVNDYDKIILSPGPGIPEEAGLLLPLIKEYAPTKSIFGVCLGQQAIGQAFGASLTNLKEVYHGVATNVNIIKEDGRLFNGLPRQILAGRYHSWVIDESTLPAELVITAKDEDGFIMAVQHNKYDVSGVQFHPESVLTPQGEKIVRNWLSL
ncbi:anthranilate synthase component 2 [Chitinophaga ginsengisegetis]|uniref:Anthranilate synthase component 2 n=1 Tax=Chitinophaga ginsengisegetis TaxID=393003 RepID=A0A1T5NZZ6_9BACT|nr:aminodeoxychorismate/anthranilate synthase component II [Chitinophaga ginsengisegetis]MDR6566966.1 anthranilate synthase component 2 [Chitinophaga ginsengisegetis]MDR6646696.1 anthranilate synthase component 2 [Chitinophaga ginsengisegetis]MDR6653046.1 anthranilate synthase component 2 [Chitinophaga ginsengisegetis]SKD06071.1 anthranilate synthase component 2 [Chitinophaga ginsengisegetis]